MRSLEQTVASAAITLALLLHGACTPAPIKGPGQGDALSHAITVRLHGHRYAKKANTPDPDSRAPLASGGRVRSGDPFDLEIVVDRSAFVQLVHVRPDGSAQLFEPGKQRALEPGRHRIPVDEDAYLTFGDVAGRDVFYVLASSKPLAEADPGLAKTLAGIRGASGKAGLAIRYVPAALGVQAASGDEGGAFTVLGRGALGRRLRDGELLVVHTDDAGMAVQRFELDHVSAAAP